MLVVSPGLAPNRGVSLICQPNQGACPPPFLDFQVANPPPLNRTAPARNSDATDAKGTSNARCAVKTKINGMSSLSLFTHARNIGHTDVKGTSIAGCAVKTLKRPAPPFHPSRMHEISVTPMRKALRLQDVLQKNQYKRHVGLHMFTSMSEPITITAATTSFFKDGCW